MIATRGVMMADNLNSRLDVEQEFKSISRLAIKAEAMHFEIIFQSGEELKQSALTFRDKMKEFEARVSTLLTSQSFNNLDHSKQKGIKRKLSEQYANLNAVNKDIRDLLHKEALKKKPKQKVDPRREKVIMQKNVLLVGARTLAMEISEGIIDQKEIRALKTRYMMLVNSPEFKSLDQESQRSFKDELLAEIRILPSEPLPTPKPRINVTEKFESLMSLAQALEDKHLGNIALSLGDSHDQIRARASAMIKEISEFEEKVNEFQSSTEFLAQSEEEQNTMLSQLNEKREDLGIVLEESLPKHLELTSIGWDKESLSKITNTLNVSPRTLATETLATMRSFVTQVSAHQEHTGLSLDKRDAELLKSVTLKVILAESTNSALQGKSYLGSGTLNDLISNIQTQVSSMTSQTNPNPAKLETLQTQIKELKSLVKNDFKKPLIETDTAIRRRMKTIFNTADKKLKKLEKELNASQAKQQKSPLIKGLLEKKLKSKTSTKRDSQIISNQLSRGSGRS